MKELNKVELQDVNGGDFGLGIVIGIGIGIAIGLAL